MDPHVKMIESVDTFEVSFGGSNNIDAELFTKVISNIFELIKISSNALEPTAFLRLEIKATTEGSFHTSLDVIVRYGNDIFNKSNLEIARNILDGFLTFLIIKQHLKGKNQRKLYTLKILPKLLMIRESP